MTVFLMVKSVNAVRRFTAQQEHDAPPAAPTPVEALLVEIRDLLKASGTPARTAPASAPPPAHQNASTRTKRS